MGNSFPLFSLLISLFALGGGTYPLSRKRRNRTSVGRWISIASCALGILLLAPSAWAEQLLTDTVASETSTNQGKYLKIIFSADDEVCQKLLRIYDSGFEDRPDMVDGEFVYPLGKMMTGAANRHDDDPMFIRWNPFAHPFSDERDTRLSQWAEFDIDNDGHDERVMRTTYSHKVQWLDDILLAYNSVTREQLSGFPGTWRDLLNLDHFAVGKPIGHGDGPLPQYPGLTEEDKGGGRAWERGCPHKSCPIYSSPSYIVPFRVKDVTYLSFFHSVLNQPGYGILGVVQRLTSKDAADDICYFDLHDAFKLRVRGE